MNFISSNLNFLLSGKQFANIRYLGAGNKTATSAIVAHTAIDTTNLRFTVVSTSLRVRGGWGGNVSYDDTGHTGNIWLSTILDAVTLDNTDKNGANAVNGVFYLASVNTIATAFWYPFYFVTLSAASHTYDMTWRTSGTAGAALTVYSSATQMIYGEIEEI
jgi:hypothetical protein